MNRRCFFIGTPLGSLPVMQHFQALANELARRGHRVFLLVPHRRVELETHTSNPAIFIWPSERPTKWADAKFVFRLIRAHQPDCLVANFAAVNLMTLVGWLTGVRQRVVWYHTMSAAINLDNHAAAWKLKLLQLRKRFVYDRCTWIVPVSQAGAEDVSRLYRQSARKLRVFLNSLADPAADGVGLDGHPPRLVCIGRLFPTKGQDVLINALPVLQKKYPDLTVEFVGDGPARDAFTRLAADLGVTKMCRFVGNTSHAEVLQRLRGATAAVVPSRSDNCPLAAIESLAVGTPVVASQVGGIPEIVRDGVDGFLVPAENPAALAAKLATVIADTALRRELGGNAREGFLARFEQRNVVREQADWLEELAA